MADDELLPAEETTEQPPIEAYETVLAARWTGPLPPPSMLSEYNRAFPGCAERIVSMAEAESRSRHENERHERESRRMIIQSDVFSQKAGLVLAFLLALFVISIGAFLIYTDRLVWGAGIVGFPLIALISLFVYGRRQQTTDLRNLLEDEENQNDE